MTAAKGRGRGHYLEIRSVFIASYDSPGASLRWWWSGDRHWLSSQTQTEPFKLVSFPDEHQAKAAYDGLVEALRGHFGDHSW